jgi:hypothetical protein
MSERSRRDVPVRQRDARPFLAFHLRACAERAVDKNGELLLLVARWVENLPAGNAQMRRIEATGSLDYADGSWHGGPAADRLIASLSASDEAGWTEWLRAFADAVEAHWVVQST